MSPPRVLLASFDASSLAERLRRATGARPPRARAAAARALRHAFGQVGGAWTPEGLLAAGIEPLFHEALLEHQLDPSLGVVGRAMSQDGTLRLALAARDGAVIESVLIPGRARTTLCVSSQVGCARGCTFCETARLGLSRQLAAGEIVDQLRVAEGERRRLLPASPPLSNVVYMGMGEPLDNLPAVLRSISLLTDARAFALSPHRVTVSTVGVADRLAAFFEGTRARLAVSLNATHDALRDRLMPINLRHDLAALRRALVAALPPGRRVLFEYVVFDGVNDAPEDATRLAEYVRGIRCRVNLIPANPGPDPALRPPREERLARLHAALAASGVVALLRRPRGRDVGGACGQLAGLRRGPQGGALSAPS